MPSVGITTEGESHGNEIRRQGLEATREEIEETLGFVPGFWELDDEDLVTEWPSFRRYAFEETAIPPNYRELIGLAIAANIKCPYCQHFHKEAARMHGATGEELTETAFLASWTARYSAISHGMDYDLDTFEAEFDRIAEHPEAQMAGDH